ncbi:MAG: hypothetical protein ACM3SP_00195 [Chloroflexota bacterium]
MPGQMLGEYSRFDIGRSARAEVDDEVESLALIKGRFVGRDAVSSPGGEKSDLKR